MPQTRAKRREWEAEPEAAPERARQPAPAGGAPYVRECVSCRRAALSDALAGGSLAWMCRATLEARHGPIAGPVAPDLCPICVDAIG